MIFEVFFAKTMCFTSQNMVSLKNNVFFGGGGNFHRLWPGQAGLRETPIWPGQASQQREMDG